ncbi:hypothetical protein ACH4PU_31190 [Streptomyces sp. NPDC021100]|uniref:hypothetical protein n=1 Tax=Streptomyces sp. NPDC021100 TaxID=3365114 RepID=UPI003797DFCF
MSLRNDLNVFRGTGRLLNALLRAQVHMARASAAWITAERAYTAGRVLVCVLLPAYLLTHLTSRFMWAWWGLMVAWAVVSGRVIHRQGWLDGWECEGEGECRAGEGGEALQCAEPTPLNDHEMLLGEQRQEADAAFGAFVEHNVAAAVTQGRKGIHTDALLKLLHEHDMLTDWKEPDIRTTCDRLGIPWRRQMSVQGRNYFGIHADDLTKHLGRRPQLPPEMVPDLTPSPSPEKTPSSPYVRGPIALIKRPFSRS